MSDTENLTLESLKAQIDTLTKRIEALETEVEHEHDDIERLKEDHRTAGTTPPPTSAPVGL